tara:strand:+ start:2060 stop:2728 length:669 start_codon:yes stop_codon:yes gene_type:complete
MGEFITLKANDGHELAAYEATPNGDWTGNLVLIQEIFGINNHIRKVVDEWADLGYHVVAPALFDRVERGVDVGYDEVGFDKGREVRGALTDDNTVLDVKAAADHLGTPGTTGIIGYCFGGYVTYLSACRLDFAAASGYYGGRITDHISETPQCPTILHFGEKDQAIPMSDVDKIRAAHPDLPIHIYPAGHGFCCNERPDYHEESCRLADQRSLELFQQHVKT